LDRFLFVFFSEDSGLLPPNSITYYVDRYNRLIEDDAQKPLYDIFKQFFGYINEGREGKTAHDDIFAYNGGLFWPDELLDSLIIDDEILKPHLLTMTAYDFQSDIDVNILGHIFENSLNEIENVTAQLEGQTVDKSKTKRKKDGVFYTPKYITKYIVENTVGKLCEEKKAEFSIVDEEYAKGRKNRKKATVKTLYDNLQEYRNWLLEITICDPACGSGAFLNQTLEFLISEHAYIDELQANLLESSIVYQDVSNHVLEKNIFGVDINEESVDIAKLSLWLRTAQRGRKLTALNNNIKCGNSLIDDPEVAGEKAFNWQNEFPQVFEKGGFDVVVGNPPYGDYFNDKEKEFIIIKYSKSFSGTFDMYIFFYELASNICTDNGRLCFITPNTFIDYHQFSGLRKLLVNNNNIDYVVGLSGVFEDAIVDTAILSLTKNNKQEQEFNGQIFKEKILSLEYEELSKISSNNLHSNGFVIKPTEHFVIQELVSKMPHRLGDVVRITQGITTGGNSCFLGKIDIFLDAGISRSSIKKVLMGKTINRYKIISDDQYILYSVKSTPQNTQKSIENQLMSFKDKLSKKRETKQGKLPWYCLHWARKEDDFNESKILIRQTADNIVGVFDNKNHYPIDSLHTLNLRSSIVKTETTDDILKYVLGILNSKLFKYLYKWKLDEKGKIYPQVKKVNIEWLPIPEIIGIQPMVDYVSDIQNLFIDINRLVFSFVKYVEKTNNLSAIPSGISGWHDYGFPKFIDSLNDSIKKNDGKKISKSEEMEWMELFEDKKAQVQELQTQINQTDKEIDKMVYELYELTPEEIEIVENSVK